jgi:prolyl 4-hydroxylase
MGRFIFAGLSVFSSIFATGRNGFVKICDSPEVYVCKNFLSDAECDYIIKIAHPYLKRSTVVDPNSPHSLTDPRRTSQGMFIPRNLKDKIVKRINQRIAQATGIPQENSEDIQVLHYDVGGEYRPHHDYFDIATKGGLSQYNRGGQRVATLMVYLKTTTAGGETIFPNGNLKIAPEKGKAVFFKNVDSKGKIDPMSLHGGAPVVKGDKWIMTRWLRERTFN